MNIPKWLGMRGKDLQLGDFKVTVKYIENKIREGWIILHGDAQTINMIERIVYTPGTPKNDDFVLIMGKILPDEETVSNIFLAKKTFLLEEKLIQWCNIERDIYEKLVMINIKEDEKGIGVIWDYSVNDNKGDIKGDNSEIIAEEVVRDILKMEE